MDFARLLKPYPPEILGHLLSAHHRVCESQRAPIAAETWNASGGQQCSIDDVEVLYEKLGIAHPLLLAKPSGHLPEPVPVMPTDFPSACGFCGNLLRACESRRAELWSLNAAHASELPQRFVFSCISHTSTLPA